MLSNASKILQSKKWNGFKTLEWSHYQWSVLLLSIVIASRPIIIFLNSSNEFSLITTDVTTYAFGIFFKIFIGLFFIGVLMSPEKLSKTKNILSAILLASSILLWIQGNFLLWDYGELNGKALNFSAYSTHGLLELLLWGFLLVIFVLKSNLVTAWAKKIFLIVFASLSLSIGMAFTEMPKNAWHKYYHADLTNYYSYSSNKNVIILVIDAARGDVFEDLLNNNLSDQEKDIFNGFTFFRNTTGVFNSTNYAVPGILTDNLYDFKTPVNEAYPQYYTSKTSLPYRLKKAGFITEVYPYAINSVSLSPKIVDNLKRNEIKSEHDFDKLDLVTKFNFSPHFVKKIFFDSSEMYATATATSTKTVKQPITDTKKKDTTELPQRVKEHLAYNRDVIKNLGSNLNFVQKPVFKYLHFHGAHFPFFHDENFIGKRLPLSLESYKKQFKGSLLLTTKALTDSLKKQGVYDDTMLIIIGDHGLHIPEASLQANNTDKKKYIVDMLAPLMMVKPFGNSSNALKTSSAPVSLFDIPATVFEALNLDAPTVGRSVFSINESEKRKRFSYCYTGPDQEGGIEYEINGDAHDVNAWKLSSHYLWLDKGSVKLEKALLEDRVERLYTYVEETDRMQIKG